MVTVSPYESGPLPSVTFGEELCALVVDTAPQVFAVVQECGVGTAEADGWVVAWGMVHGDGRVQVVSADGEVRMSLSAPERALRFFGRGEGVSARLVWLDSARAASLERAEAA